jgi:uncharacterized protein (TIGR04255 family)
MTPTTSRLRLGGAAFAILQIFLRPPGAVAPAVQANPPSAVAGFRLGNVANDEFVQLTGSNFVYQLVGGTYPGWPALKGKLMSHWSCAQDVVSPEKLIKVGLRYVNRIAKEANHNHLRDWLKASYELPASLIASEGHFFSRIESLPTEGNLKLVTVGNQDPNPDVPHGARRPPPPAPEVDITDAILAYQRSFSESLRQALDSEVEEAKRLVARANRMVGDSGLGPALAPTLLEEVKYWPSWSQRERFSAAR